MLRWCIAFREKNYCSSEEFKTRCLLLSCYLFSVRMVITYRDSSLNSLLECVNIKIIPNIEDFTDKTLLMLTGALKYDVLFKI